MLRITLKQSIAAEVRNRVTGILGRTGRGWDDKTWCERDGREWSGPRVLHLCDSLLAALNKTIDQWEKETR